VPWDIAALPSAVHASAPRSRAARDYIARSFRRALGRGGDMAIDAGAQTVLERTACLFTEEGVELRFTVHLPANGRRIQGHRARDLLCRDLPRHVATATEPANLDLEALERHCATVEDQVELRAQLAERGLVAFVGDGAHLPRRSGIDDRPLADAIAFNSPDPLRVTLEAPNAGPVNGLGIPAGITLIVGGGFHGKSTLLTALELGIHDHVPADGRELVVTDPKAVKIRAEDGRAVAGVDLSPFINNLPYGKSTESFSTELASGSTSQAAALVEALETGASTLLVDEDTSATNFMIRDERMQALVAKEAEPITPFVDRVRQLRDSLDISTVLVMGGSGDYFDCADTVIQLHEYHPLDVTKRTHEIAASHRTGRRAEHGDELQRPATRQLDPGSLTPEVRSGKRKIQARGHDTLVFGREAIDLRAVEQIADPSQIRTIGLLLAQLAAEHDTISDPCARIETLLELGCDGIGQRPDGDLALPRAFEVMAALNRLRGVRLQ
jgi:predicted ABC-class ATPase